MELFYKSPVSWFDKLTMTREGARSLLHVEGLINPFHVLVSSSNHEMKRPDGSPAPWFDKLTMTREGARSLLHVEGLINPFHVLVSSSNHDMKKQDVSPAPWFDKLTMTRESCAPCRSQIRAQDCFESAIPRRR
jgi:hypothetical protein